MYGIYTYIWLIFMVNVGKYAIHGSYGSYMFLSSYRILLLWYFDLITFLDQTEPTRGTSLNRWTVLDASNMSLKSLGEIHQVTELFKTSPSNILGCWNLFWKEETSVQDLPPKPKNPRLVFNDLDLYCEVGRHMDFLYASPDSPWPPKQTKRNHCITISLGVPRCETYAISSDISFHLYQLSILDVSCYVITEQVNKSSNHSFLIQNHY